MDRMVKATINGEIYPLNFSIEVMFLMNEKFGNLDKAFDILSKDDKEGFEAVKWFAVTMANDGELCRREKRQEPRQLLKMEDISLRISPMEFNLLRAAITDAITKGYSKEIEGDKEQDIDLGLAELESKKSGGQGLRASLNYIAVTILHLSRHEFYRMNPGLFYDMVQIHKDRLPKQPNADID